MSKVDAATKAAEVIAESAAPAVETAMQIGEALADKVQAPVEVVFEVIQKTPVNGKRLAIVGAAAVFVAVGAGAGAYWWSRKKNKADDSAVEETINEAERIVVEAENAPKASKTK
jgi:nitrogen fixation-related uncharacterized protein